jgi:hypothetical protein
MKKIFTYLSALLVAQTVAQTVNLCDFEGVKFISFREYNGVLDTMAANPYTVSIDTSAHCAKYIRDTATFDNIKFFAQNHYVDVTPFASTTASNKFTMKVWSTMPVGSQIDVQFGTRQYNTYPQAVHSEYSAFTTVTRAWELVTFNYKAVQGGTFPYGASCDKIIVLFHPNSHTRDTIYFDDPTGPANVPVGLIERGDITTFKISQNKPNPAKDITNFKLELSSGGHVNIQLFDMLGKLVTTVSDQQMSPGNHTISIDTGTIPNGIYFYTVRKEGITQTMKMVVSK